MIANIGNALRPTWTLALTCAALFAGCIHASAQDTRIRGTISALDGQSLTVKALDGASRTILVPEAARISITKPFSLSEIKPGITVGVTTVKRADGQLVAVEVHPNAPTTKQGLSPNDLRPQATMTNGVIEGTVQANGNEITVNYGSGTAKILVLPETTLYQSAPGTQSDLKVGEAVNVTATDEGGKLTATRVQVGKDGVKPPQ